MSKGLEALEKLTNYKCSRMSEKIECKEIIKKELKALEIIKKLFYKYRNDIELVASCEDGKPIYLLRMGKKKINRKWIYLLILTQEEYDLLKEVLL